MDEETRALQEELEHYRREKEKIRQVVGAIGGATGRKWDALFNTLFIVAILALFTVDAVRHLAAVPIPIPAVFSLELGVLLVSIKIVWMIHRQGKVEHFQFWILNAIEFRLNTMAKRIEELKSGDQPPQS